MCCVNMKANMKAKDLIETHPAMVDFPADQVDRFIENAEAMATDINNYGQVAKIDPEHEDDFATAMQYAAQHIAKAVDQLKRSKRYCQSTWD